MSRARPNESSDGPEDPQFGPDRRSATQSARLIRKPRPGSWRGGRFWRWAFVGLLGLAATIFFAPTLIGQTALGDWLLKQLIPSTWGTLEIGRRDLSWWSPIVAGDIKFRDAQGELLAEIETLRTKETLWELLKSRTLSQVDIERAAVRLEWRHDGSNWEDWLVALTGTSTESQAGTGDDIVPELRIRFRDCQAILDSQTDRQRWLAQDLHGEVSIRDNAQWILIQAEAHLMDMNQNSGAGQVRAQLLIAGQGGLREAAEQWHLPPVDSRVLAIHTTTGGLAFDAEVDQVAAGVGQSILRRYLPGLDLEGVVTGRVAGLSNWYGDFFQIQTPKLVVDHVTAAEGYWLAGDRVRQRQIQVGGGVVFGPDQLDLRQVRLQADFGRAEVEGTLNFEQVTTAWQTRRLPTEGISSSGSVQLAELANQLPRTLQLQEDVKLDQGDLTWQIFNRAEADGSWRLFVDIVAKNIAGRSSAGRVQWPAPIHLSTSLRDYDRPATFDHFDLQSDFLVAEARPQPNGETQVIFGMDFDRLRSALDQFFQLPPMIMRGRAEGQASWRMRSGDQLASRAEAPSSLDLKAEMTLAGAHLAFPNYFELREPNLRLQANTVLEWGSPTAQQQGWSALWSPEADVTIRSGGLELVTVRPGQARQLDVADAPADALGLLVALREPVQLARLNQIWAALSGTVPPLADSRPDSVLEAEIAINGPLDEWLEIARPLLADTDLALTGNCQTRFHLTLKDRYALLSHLQGSSRNFGFRGFGMLLQEPMVQVAGAVSYHYSNGLIHTGEFKVAGSTLAARAVQTRMLFSPLGNRMEGEIHFRGDLARIWHTYQLIQTAAAEEGEPKKLGRHAIPWQSLPKPNAYPEFAQIALVGWEEATVPESGALPGGHPVAGAGGTAPNASPMGMGGQVVGVARLKPTATQGTAVDLEAWLQEAWIGGRQAQGHWVAWIKEPQIHLRADGEASSDFRVLELNDLRVDSQRLSGVAAGRLTDLDREARLELRGHVDSAAMEWIRQFAGPELADLRINGLQKHSFDLQGPLSLTGLQGRWVSQWQEIRWMGLVGGPADIVLHLNQGLMRMQPLRFAAGGGQVHLSPELDLRGDPIWIRLPRGFIFENVQLTPQICRNWLKYSAPLLAEVTSVQGTFSLDSDGIEVPLSDWTKMVAKARVTINGARVGPGPLGIQIGQIANTVRTVADGRSLDAAALEAVGLGSLSGLARGGNGQRAQAIEGLASNVLGVLGSGTRPLLDRPLPTGNGQAPPPDGSPGSPPPVWLEIPPQTIALHYQDGGVVHDRLRFQIRGFELVTQGKVGLDQSLAIQAQLNLPEELLSSHPEVAAALGPRVQLPISGTLSEPSISSGPLRTALNSAVNVGIERALGDQVERLGIGPDQIRDPVQGLLQQGQQRLERLEDRLQDRLGLPPLPNPPLPDQNPLNPPPRQNPNPVGSGTGLPAVEEAGDAVNRWLNRGLDRGRQRLLGDDK